MLGHVFDVNKKYNGMIKCERCDKYILNEKAKVQKWTGKM
jgi:hypothetical protein